MSDPLHQADLSTGLICWADGMGALRTHTSAAIAVIQQALAAPYTDYQSAQLTEAGYARHRAAYVQAVRRQDGALCARLARLNLAAMPDACPVVYGGVALYTADDWLRRVER